MINYKAGVCHSMTVTHSMSRFSSLALVFCSQSSRTFTDVLQYVSRAPNLTVTLLLQHFYHFLGHPNKLSTLDLSNTDCSLDTVSC